MRRFILSVAAAPGPLVVKAGVLPSLALASLALACLAGAAGCGGGGSKGTVMPPTDAGMDAIDAPRMGVMCTAAVPGQPRGLGACCVANADCSSGICWDGFCSKTCATTADCGPAAAPSPLPVGTTFACASNQLGDPLSLCLPGSLQACANGVPCPKGEACALGLNPAAVPPASASTGAYQGMCLTTLIANQFPPAGTTCQAEDGPYACENEGGYLGTGCFAHRCSLACGSDADCPVAMFCSPAPYSAVEGGGASIQPHTGVGVCLGRFCGQVHGDAGLATNQLTQQGADGLCPPGEVCAPTVVVGAAGDTSYLSCVPPRAGAVAFGERCSLDPAARMRCADDALCVTVAGGLPFCSTLCRTDADCPTGNVCLDDIAKTPLPNGSVARLSMCVPPAVAPGTPCQGEKDCLPGQACLPASTRSTLLTCQAAVGTKSVGDACAAAAECRSGECVDRDLHSPTGLNRTYCGAFCTKNSACGAGQICLSVVRSNNGTTQDPTDDISLGYCTTLDAPAKTGACTTNLNCTAPLAQDEMGGDTCDPVHLTCYSSTAHLGDACTHRAQCPLGAYCRVNDPAFPGGACLQQGCDPAAVGGPDLCPAGSVCGQRPADRPLYACYQACGPGQPCSRQAEQYYCSNLGAVGTPLACLASGGNP